MGARVLDGRYNLVRKVVRGDPARGIPDLWQCHDAGDTYYAKLWKRGKSDQRDIQALWNREVRGLSRLQGYPGANEIFARFHDLGTTQAHYFVVIDGGNRELLSDYIAKRHQVRWLTNLSEAARRRALWEGLSIVADGISILHNEGTLHRALSSSTIFVGSEGKCDFRLSGFEWSLRVSSREKSQKKIARYSAVNAPELKGEEADEYSSATDWFDFGLLVAEVFGVPVNRLKQLSSVVKSVRELRALRNDEKELILQLLDEDIDGRMAAAESVQRSMHAIINSLTIATIASNRSLMVAVRLNPDMDFAASIERASKGTVSRHNPKELIDWIRSDVRGDPRIVARLRPYPHYVIKGRMLEYRVKQWSADSSATWDIGFCESIETTPQTLTSDIYFSLGQRRLELQLYPTVRNAVQTIRDRSVPWDKALPLPRQTRALAPELKLVHDFFVVTQQLDILLIAAQICPVRVLDQRQDGISTEIEVTPVEEIERNELARHLALPKPSELVMDWFSLGGEAVTFDDDEGCGKDKYSFLDRHTVTKDTSEGLEWQFVGGKHTLEGPKYVFRCQNTITLGQDQNYYLAKNYSGTIAQARRRHDVIDAMKFHEGLLRFLADPTSAMKKNAGSLPNEKHRIELDSSKLDALTKVWGVQPGFALQGPPGTGKTTLIKAFVDRLLGADPSSQILISAHSHHTVDDVLAKVSSLFSQEENANRPLILRLGGTDRSPFDIEVVSKEIADRLAESQLVKDAPPFLQRRALSMSDGTAVSDADLRSIALLVQDSANLTFTTLNSSDLASLTSRNRRFDWSIIEEAGKAHGFDMAAALQESHRLLLIGDHFQLPPFNAQIFQKLLADPLRIQKAIQAGEVFAPQLVDAALVMGNDDEDRPFEEKCQQWRSMVKLFGTLFVDDNQTPIALRPSATLTDQHRMHPDIAEIVGKVFYQDSDGGTILKSPPETVERFNRVAPFHLKSGTWMPEQRIVWCDIPWVQKERFSVGEEEGLFKAPKEAEVVADVLEQFRGRESQECSIQILSPYNAQLDEIKRALHHRKDAGLLSSMFASPFNLQSGKRIGATVDEFQGSEADIVVVSLVRNNGLAPWRSMGFLKEANRMNVLLSRAKHKLVIVGSWDFWASRCDEDTPPDAEYAYVGRMMNVLETAKQHGRLAKVARK